MGNLPPVLFSRPGRKQPLPHSPDHHFSNPYLHFIQLVQAFAQRAFYLPAKTIALKPIIPFVVLFFLAACSKTPHREQEDLSTSLVLNMAQSALSLSQVDSADVVFRKVGSSETSKAKFVKKAGSLAVPLSPLAPGTWNADVELYTRAVNGTSNQYKLVKGILVTEEKTGVVLPGPGAVSGNGWLKRHVKASAGNEVVVIVPDEVYDSYFEFRAKTTGLYAMGIQREAINVNHLVKQETWACTNACFNGNGQLINNDHFMPFAQAILSSPWTRNEISIAVVNGQQETVLTYDRIWVQ